MPTLRKDRDKEWLARVVLEGRQVASRTFPPGRKMGPEWTAAKSWEVETKRNIEELLSKGYNLPDALETLGLRPGQKLLAELQQQEKRIPMGLKKLLAWGDGYLAHVQRIMSRATYVEKQSHMYTFFAFCQQESIQDLSAVTKPKAYAFLAGIRDAKAMEAEERLTEGQEGEGTAEKRKKGGTIGNPSSVANKYRKNIMAAWHWGAEYIEGFPEGRSPFAMVPEFPVDEMERYVPPEEDVVKVLEEAKGQDLVMLLVFYYTGARAGEVFKLSWKKDIRLDKGKIRLEDHKTRGRKKRTRWQDMHPELVKALSWWFESRPCKVDNVFMQTHCGSAMGMPFRHRSKFCARLCDRAKVTPFVFYSIRHVSGHISFREGGVSAAMSLLGHYHATTTDKYLRKMGLYTNQSAIQASLGRSDIGQAGIGLMENLMTECELQQKELQQKEEMPHELRTHEAFCNPNDVTHIIQ